METENVTGKLLRLCTSLNAKKDGFAILNLLARDFREDFEHIGLFNEDIGEVAVEFVCRVTGKYIFGP